VLREGGKGPDIRIFGAWFNIMWGGKQDAARQRGGTGWWRVIAEADAVGGPEDRGASLPRMCLRILAERLLLQLGGFASPRTGLYLSPISLSVSSSSSVESETRHRMIPRPSMGVSVVKRTSHFQRFHFWLARESYG